MNINVDAFRKFSAFFVLFGWGISHLAIANPLPKTAKWERHNEMSPLGSIPEKAVNIFRAGDWAYREIGGYIQIATEVNAKSPNTEKAAQKIYVQWVRTDSHIDEQVYSIAVKELSEIPNYQFANPECNKASACNTLSIPASHVYEGYEQNFEIEIGGLGEYKFSSGL